MHTMSIFDKIQETAAFIQAKINLVPTTGIILGSGLGGLKDLVTVETEISYTDIPNFPVSTVKGHESKLLFGKLGEKAVVLMAGRFHYYEGYSMQEVTFPIRVMKALGVQTLIVSNAAGGMNKNFAVGDIVIIRDHINLFPEHPLRGANDERLGMRFPDMSEPYDAGMIASAQQIAAELGFKVQTGVYVGFQGPTFETRSEYKMLHTMGADLVGMSTVPEVIVAIHGGLKVFGASIVTDMGIREELNKITHEEVLQAANEAAPKLARLVAELVKTLPASLKGGAPHQDISA